MKSYGKLMLSLGILIPVPFGSCQIGGNGVAAANVNNVGVRAIRFSATASDIVTPAYGNVSTTSVTLSTSSLAALSTSSLAQTTTLSTTSSSPVSVKTETTFSTTTECPTPVITSGIVSSVSSVKRLYVNTTSTATSTPGVVQSTLTTLESTPSTSQSSSQVRPNSTSTWTFRSTVTVTEHSTTYLTVLYTPSSTASSISTTSTSELSPISTVTLVQLSSYVEVSPSVVVHNIEPGCTPSTVYVTVTAGTSTETETSSSASMPFVGYETIATSAYPTTSIFIASVPTLTATGTSAIESTSMNSALNGTEVSSAQHSPTPTSAATGLYTSGATAIDFRYALLGGILVAGAVIG